MYTPGAPMRPATPTVCWSCAASELGRTTGPPAGRTAIAATPSSSTPFQATTAWPVCASTPTPGSEIAPPGKAPSSCDVSSPRWNPAPGEPQADTGVPSDRVAADSPIDAWTACLVPLAVFEAALGGDHVLPPSAEVAVASTSFTGPWRPANIARSDGPAASSAGLVCTLSP